GHVELVSAGFGRMIGDGLEFLCGQLCVVEERWRCRGCALIDAAFDPELSREAALPVGEDGDAVACAHDVAEVVFELAEWQVLIDDLGDLKARLQCKRDMSDDADRA